MSFDTRDRAGGESRVDPRAVARAFNRAAGGYESAAALQRRSGSELLQRLTFFALRPACIVDLGAGTCEATPELARRFPQARVLAIDFAEQMLARSPRPLWRRRRFERVCADGYALPLASQCCELVYSNLMLQWCERLPELFSELARVLRPGGLLLFSSFGPDTLQELRSAWLGVDGPPHVHEFPDLAQVAEALIAAGFSEPVIDREREVRHYESVRALMRELKQLGAQNAAPDRPRGLGGRARLEAVCSAYEQHRDAAGVPATWELLFGAAFAGARPGAGAGVHRGEFAVPITHIARPTRRGSS